MPNLDTLYQVQVHELKIDHARERLDEIDRILKNDEALIKAQADAQQAQTTFQESRALVKDLELELDGLKTKIEEVNDLLYGGKLKNPKELKERQDELESLKHRQEILEERLLIAVETAEAAENNVAESKAFLANLENTRAEESTALLEERATLDKQIKAALRERKAIIADVPNGLMKQFRALRKAKGQAIARLNGNSCELCAIEQPSSEIQRILTSDDLVRCVGCGRILVNP